MEGDTGAAQETIKLFATEDGLAFLKDLVERHTFLSIDAAGKVHHWLNQVQPLLQLVTHERVLDSAVLELDVATIYNVMQGIGGRRMKTLFEFVLDLLEVWSTLPIAAEDEHGLSACALSLTALAKMIDCNTTNVVNENFNRIIDRLEFCLGRAGQSSDEFSKMQARKSLQYLRRRLGVGDAILEAQTNNRTPVDRAEFFMRKDLPGNMSADGPRHNNDHADISKISILPTREEITSSRGEYLPTNDSSQFHIDGINGRLDREFRLLREDTVGQLRDVVRLQLEFMQNPERSRDHRDRNGVRTYIYNDPIIRNIEFDKRLGLDFTIQFRQPAQGKKSRERQEWWGHSKRLQPGGLLCVLSKNGSVLFCVVAETTIVATNAELHLKRRRTPATAEDEEESSKQAPKASLADDETSAYVHLHLAEIRPANIGQRCLVEFPGILLPSFQHTLAALQRMSKTPDMPFIDLLTPSQASPGGVEVPPPAYTLKPGFSFDLSCVTNDNTSLQLAKHSTLDATQSSALLDTLSRSLVLIQGPPGTGKSFTGEKIIKVLLANKKKAGLGPILCLLEHLLDDGVKKIIRIGSRSKSERLEQLNIRVVAKTADRTKAEKALLWETKKSLDQHVGLLDVSIKNLESVNSPETIKNYLFIKGIGKWTEQWRRGGFPGTSPPRQVDDLIEANLWQMTREERSHLISYWLREIHYEAAKANQNKISREVDLRCLHEADIVDLLLKLRSKVMLCEEAGEVLEAHMLTALLPSVEHAILIGDHLQLRPQINNYDLQSNNPRGAQYSLDVSLFERLINPPHETDIRLPFNTLQTQRRMHPSVSELIRSTLYPSLEDGETVNHYPEVLGMKKRLYWLHHEAPEDQASQLDATTTSRTNAFEMNMTIALVQHLVRQGSYGPDDIAVITPYLGQLHQLRRAIDLEELEVLEASRSGDGPDNIPQPNRPVSTKTTLLKSIRLATVDNFQGEEAKVVVISLVRSNKQNKCGFLSTSNRINVLLSRAQHGMYLIGNSNTYRHVNMWAKVLDILVQTGNFGDKLELQCPRHPDTPILVSDPDHFLQFSPEGGCNLPCDRRLPCGHSCISRCHHNTLHKAVKCLEPCPRPKKGCDHPCRRDCGEPCLPKCVEKLRGLNITLSCGHKVSSALCWQAQNPSTIACQEKVQKTVPGCDHTLTVTCPTDVSVDAFKCGEICGEPQRCGHSCRSECWRCRERAKGKITKVNHGICQQPCDRKYTTCPHSCKEPCHGEAKCPPCPRPCEVRCSHSKCSKLCHEPCAPCAEQTCASRCPHIQCTMPCAAPCNWVPCSKRCEKVLSCGHQCPSLCGETCPDEKYCQICCVEDIKETEVDFIMGNQYHEIDLDEEPCLFPDCGHFIIKSNMDGLMDMKAHYKMSAEDNPVALVGTSTPFSMDEVKNCPTCRGSLRNIARYGRIVRRAMLDEATKKFMAWSNSKFLYLAEDLGDIRQNLEKNRDPKVVNSQNTRPTKISANGRLKELHLIRDWVGSGRYAAALKLWHDIKNFIKQVQKAEQPFQRVADFVQHAARQHSETGGFHFDESLIQYKSQLQASALWLRCEVIIISDFMELRPEIMQSRPKLKLDFSKQMSDCQELIELAKRMIYPRQEVEAHIFFAQFCAFTRILGPAAGPDESGETGITAKEFETLKEQGLDHLTTARAIVEQYSGQAGMLLTDIDAAEAMLREGVFYMSVSAYEMQAVYGAMAGEFLGTGHWYTCERGHPFTVGECGMPMEMAQCPECGAPVGGAHHTPAQGVRRADEIERLAQEVEQMGI
ncbi:uncharacterized protein BCR38DRAFT_455826 [Pseudomassariella vexata]|uniref:RZ-type domain-containing protein n=1 Tax=Pseudomassariella vexata TaxID=1141098 RepID=A0A1Y2EE26_9PEZI|nr:uncharacterized protein BCR38DRAFT_455826 [Pseudomassariella vexata]ORY69045.1 hypothetical protein BCR38DRAFT_455826 [Pseudomassariella vexata]